MPIDSPAELHTYIVCADVLVRKGDQYLILKRSPLKRYAAGVHAPIGGKVEIGENPYEAAIREVAEEAGISIKNLKLEGVVQEISPVKNEDTNWLVFHFSADYDSGEVHQTAEGELFWLGAEELMTRPLFPSVRKIIHHMLNREVGTVFTTNTYNEDGSEVISERIGICKA
jgi:8-oxo-dGTP diphosphatase